MVVTQGDYFGDLVNAKGLGISVPAEEVDVLADALEEMLYDEKSRAQARKNVSEVRTDFEWPKVLAPLVAYVDAVAFGSAPATVSSHRSIRYSPQRKRPPRFRPADIGLAFQRLAKGEFSSLWRALLRRIRPSGR
jgi:hypothetical protein